MKKFFNRPERCRGRNDARPGRGSPKFGPFVGTQGYGPRRCGRTRDQQVAVLPGGGSFRPLGRSGRALKTNLPETAGGLNGSMQHWLGITPARIWREQ
jgi:hypothetical protein